VTEESTPPDMATTTRVSCGRPSTSRLLRIAGLGRSLGAGDRGRPRPMRGRRRESSLYYRHSTARPHGRWPPARRRPARPGSSCRRSACDAQAAPAACPPTLIKPLISRKFGTRGGWPADCNATRESQLPRLPVPRVALPPSVPSNHDLATRARAPAADTARPSSPFAACSAVAIRHRRARTAGSRARRPAAHRARQRNRGRAGDAARRDARRDRAGRGHQPRDHHHRRGRQDIEAGADSEAEAIPADTRRDGPRRSTRPRPPCSRRRPTVRRSPTLRHRPCPQRPTGGARGQPPTPVAGQRRRPRRSPAWRSPPRPRPTRSSLRAALPPLLPAAPTLPRRRRRAPCRQTKRRQPHGCRHARRQSSAGGGRDRAFRSADDTGHRSRDHGSSSPSRNRRRAG
jgi:hypothetical protein